ncbi:hypothetical protein HY642_00795 [Candidatus Woesearchaeota archaeon]|nr:hypothetical protein [Candidatus Woesearchaeota archaeon]
MARGYWSTLVVMIVSLVGTLWLEMTLVRGYKFEMFVMLVGLALGALLLYGIAENRKWAWPMATVYFSAALANLAMVFYSTRRHVLAFGITAFFAAMGIVNSLLRMPDDDLSTLEPYPAPPAPVKAEAPVAKAEKPAKAKKRKK